MSRAMERRSSTSEEPGGVSRRADAPNVLLAKGGALALAYFLASLVGLNWAQVEGAGSPVWPAFGISLAALLLGGIRLWPAIVVGRLAAGLVSGSEQPLWAEAAIALGNGIADAIGVALIHRFGGINRRLSRMGDVFILAGAVAIAAAISATIGTVTLDFSSAMSAAATLRTWQGWWFANVVAGLTIAPLILTLSAPAERLALARKPGGAALCLGILTIAASAIFLHQEVGLRSWHIYPLLIWVSLSFGVSGAAAGLTIVSVLGIAGATSLDGPVGVFVSEPVVAVMVTQQFIAVTALTMLLLAAVSDERRGKLAIATKNEELRAANSRLAESLAQEELLTVEINHRVKNSLQLVGSLLWLQSRHLAGEQSRAVLDTARRRIGVIAAIHQALYTQGAHINVQMTPILRSLAADALAKAGAGSRIEWSANIADIELPVNRAVAFSLIVSELLSNALTFGFPETGNGSLAMTLERVRDDATFTLADDGPGLPARFDMDRDGGVGLRIVNALIDQLEAEMRVVRTETGACFELRFRAGS